MPKNHDYFDRAVDFYGFDPKLDQALFVALPGEIIPVGSGEALWRSMDGARAEALTPPEAAVLSLCRTFGRRDELVEQVAGATGQPRHVVAGVVDVVIARGLLARPTDFLGADRSQLPAAPAPLVLLRAGPGLPALLESLAHHDAQAGQRRFAVWAGSAGPDAGERWRAVTRDFARAQGAQVDFIGADEAMTLADQWLEPLDAAARGAIGELLHPDRVGAGAAAWNWALLLGAGGTVAVLDDDARFPVRVPIGWDARLELFDSPIAEARYFDDDGELARLHAYDGDPLAFAARFVGQPARALLRTGDSRFLELWGAVADEVAHVTPRARVAGAVAGLWGALDVDPAILLELGERGSLRDLWRAPYSPARLEGTRVWHGVRHPRLLSAGTRRPLVLDDRTPLAFAPGPNSASADLPLLAMLQALDPDARFVFLPLLVGRAAGSARTTGASAVDGGAVLARVLAGFGATLQASSPETRMEGVCALAGEHARAPALALADLLHRIQMTARCDYARRLADALEQNTAAPAEWRTRIARELDTTHASLASTTPDPMLIVGLRAALDLVERAGRSWRVAWARARALAERQD